MGIAAVSSTKLLEYLDDPKRPDQSLTIPSGWRPTAAEPLPVVRCTMIKRDGTRCKKWSLRGTTVCVKHGASLPDVREHAAALVEAARLRIIGNTDMAVDVLEDLMQPGTADAIRLKAADSILDRAGIRGGLQIDVEVTDNTSPAEALLSRLSKLNASADILDAEVLDSEEDLDQLPLF